jgi:hypothetical protein
MGDPENKYCIELQNIMNSKITRILQPWQFTNEPPTLDLSLVVDKV